MLTSLRTIALFATMWIPAAAASGQASAQSIEMPSDPSDAPMASVPVPARPATNADSVYVNPEVLPQFTGGNKAFAEYLRKSMRYPTQGQQSRTSGRVLVNFTLSAEGKVQDAHVVSGPGKALNDEALRLVWLMPNWVPARANGEPVRVACTIPITFGR
ncbi:energy transducer TonB [Hymenobacter sp. IS2118]|uniref:energy transducer TonB n=1 Tax=Hymenobacter sp. IS2118 TaxID=1505605 RepID=UPI001268A28D|nr:energy transducer TonB [Hymenobacter sp. IS2118]